MVSAALRRAWSAEITPWRPSVIRFDLPFALVCTTYTFDPEGYTLTPKPGSSRSQNTASLSSTESPSTVRLEMVRYWSLAIMRLRCCDSPVAHTVP